MSRTDGMAVTDFARAGQRPPPVVTDGDRRRPSMPRRQGTGPMPASAASVRSVSTSGANGVDAKGSHVAKRPPQKLPHYTRMHLEQLSNQELIDLVLRLQAQQTRQQQAQERQQEAAANAAAAAAVPRGRTTVVPTAMAQAFQPRPVSPASMTYHTVDRQRSGSPSPPVSPGLQDGMPWAHIQAVSTATGLSSPSRLQTATVSPPLSPRGPNQQDAVPKPIRRVDVASLAACVPPQLEVAPRPVRSSSAGPPGCVRSVAAPISTIQAFGRLRTGAVAASGDDTPSTAPTPSMSVAGGSSSQTLGGNTTLHISSPRNSPPAGVGQVRRFVHSPGGSTVAAAPHTALIPEAVEATQGGAIVRVRSAPAMGSAQPHWQQRPSPIPAGPYAAPVGAFASAGSFRLTPRGIATTVTQEPVAGRPAVQHLAAYPTQLAQMPMVPQPAVTMAAGPPPTSYAREDPGSLQGGPDRRDLSAADVSYIQDARPLGPTRGRAGSPTNINISNSMQAVDLNSHEEGVPQPQRPASDRVAERVAECSRRVQRLLQESHGRPAAAVEGVATQAAAMPPPGWRYAGEQALLHTVPHGRSIPSEPSVAASASPAADFSGMSTGTGGAGSLAEADAAVEAPVMLSRLRLDTAPAKARVGRTPHRAFINLAGAA
eukprot:TRINITY_DN24497_c0_g1_i1.p1 TRINITY_DN24497_c0_g1~~TRINITY_DN24497_c0_g1_i1.p1  ORF type:complete len:656 (+),score=91.75 TRINITY_DN24497_c0_g1_i1:71-2038(+)